MGNKTAIEWTDASWNPIRGCSRVSEGCRHCYAETVANRFCGPGKPYEGVVRIGADGKGTGQWNGEIKFLEERLLDPLRWKTAKRIFVNSMSDLFHENVTDEMLDRIFAVMALCPQHTFQVLTKRPERMLAYLRPGQSILTRLGFHAAAILHGYKFRGREFGAEEASAETECREPKWPLPNVWLGVSVERQKEADERIPLLLQTPAAVRFISAEPLLGPVNLGVCESRMAFTLQGEKVERLGTYLTREAVLRQPGYPEQGQETVGAKLDWVICGGESGSGARPIHPDWARSLRDQCKAAGVPFFFKQWGEWAEVERRFELPAKPWMVRRDDTLVRPDGTTLRYDDCGGIEEAVPMRRVGKKAAGHLLDGEVIQQFPEVRVA